MATHEAKRGRGYGRCMLEAIEDATRGLGIPLLLLCSTKEEGVQNTWKHLGFRPSTEEQLGTWDVLESVRARGGGGTRGLGVGGTLNPKPV